MNTEIFKYAENGNLNKVKKLLNTVNLNIKNNGKNLLHTAIFHGQSKVARFLIYKGIHINSITSFGNTALNMASSENNFDLVKCLVENGADVHIKNSSGNSPLHATSRYGTLEMFKCLVENGADINDTGYGKSNCLHFASGGCNTELVEYLSTIFDPNSVTTDSSFPLIFCITSPESFVKKIKTAKILLSHGAEINKKNSSGHSPLFISTAYESDELVKLLLDHGADVNITDSEGCTPLMKAQNLAYTSEISELLLYRGAKVNMQDNYGNTALRYAANHRHEYLKLLIQHGGNLSIKNNAGLSPIQKLPDKVKLKFFNFACMGKNNL